MYHKIAHRCLLFVNDAQITGTRGWIGGILIVISNSKRITEGMESDWYVVSNKYVYAYSSIMGPLGARMSVLVMGGEFLG